MTQPDARITYWHDDPTQHPSVGTLMWHVHHAILCEPLPLVNRLAYIREYKPEDEIDTRLRWLTPVKGDVPADRDRALADYYRTRADYNRTLADSKSALEVLHASEHPGCPWDGASLFPDAQP